MTCNSLSLETKSNLVFLVCSTSTKAVASESNIQNSSKDNASNLLSDSAGRGYNKLGATKPDDQGNHEGHDDLSQPDEGTTFLDACGIWTVGCSLEQTFDTIRLCCASGAKRFACPHPTLITHIVKGSDLGAMEAREVLQYVNSQHDVPVVTFDWLVQSVARKEMLPADNRFLVSRAELEQLDPGRLRAIGKSAVAPRPKEDDAISNPAKSNESFLSGCYFTLAAVRGSADEFEAESLVRKFGGKLFNSSLPSSVPPNKTYAICPPSFPNIDASKLKSSHNDFAIVSEGNRYTVYWLRCCAEAGRILSPQRGSPCFRPLPFKLPLDGMENISVAISGYDPAVRAAIKFTVETLGGSVSMDYMSAKDTHLLVPAAHGDKYKHSNRLGVTAVTAEWLIDSVSAGKIQAEKNYKPRPLPGHATERSIEASGDTSRIEVSQQPWSKSLLASQKLNMSVDMGSTKPPDNSSNMAAVAQGGHASRKRKSEIKALPSLPGSFNMARKRSDTMNSEKGGELSKRTATDGSKKIDPEESFLASVGNANAPEGDTSGLAKVVHDYSNLLQQMSSRQVNDKESDFLAVDVDCNVVSTRKRARRRSERRGLSSSTSRQGSRQVEDKDTLEASQKVGYESAVDGLSQLA